MKVFKEYINLLPKTIFSIIIFFNILDPLYINFSRNISVIGIVSFVNVFGYFFAFYLLIEILYITIKDIIFEMFCFIKYFVRKEKKNEKIY